MNDLKVFVPYNEDLYREMTQLLTTDDLRYEFCAKSFSSFKYADYCVLRWAPFSCLLFRKNESLSSYRDTNSSRVIMMNELKKIIEANPLFHGKLKYPDFRSQRLQRLINQRSATSSIHSFFSDELNL